MPKQGHGQYRKLSKALSVHPVLISQVFKGSKDLTLEQAHLTSRFFQLTELETEFFLALVQQARAGTHDLKLFLQSQIHRLRERSHDLKHRVRQDAQLDEQAKTQFYSQWQYSAVRLLSAIPGYGTASTISDRLGIPEREVQTLLEFLLTHNLVVRQEDGSLAIGPRVTHLEATSPLIRSRQIQWRLKGFEAMNARSPDDLFYTGPMTLSRDLVERIRKDLIQLIERISHDVAPSASEELACLNIDWFRI